MILPFTCRSIKNSHARSTTLLAAVTLVLAAPNALQAQANSSVVQQAKFTAPDAAAGDLFGGAVAIDGDTALIGAPQLVFTNGVPSEPGKAFVFTRSGTTWTQQAELAPSDPQPGGEFGGSAAVSGGTIAIGAPNMGTSANGAVYVFTRSGNSWIQQAKIVPQDLEFAARFGQSVALNGDTLVVGAIGQKGTGVVYVFTRSGAVWTEQAELTASDAAGGEQFGFSVSLSNTTLAIGSPGSGDSTDGTVGRAYVFTLSQGVWSQQAELSRSEGSAIDLFGSSVSLSGNTVVATAPAQNLGTGAAYVFTQSGTTWTKQAKLTASDATQFAQFGASAVISGNFIVIGATNNNVGAGYLFAQTGSNWTQLAKFASSDEAVSDGFGHPLAASGISVLAGAFQKQGNNGIADAGAAYAFQIADVTLLSNPAGRIFELSGSGCNTPGQFTAPYVGFWTNCSVQWISPDVSNPQVHYTLENWWDQSAENPRTFSPDPSEQTTISADFETEYELTTQVLPNAAGIVTGAGFYPAGTSASVAAFPQPGMLFIGFNGAAAGTTTPQSVVMNGPQTITASFSPIPTSSSGAVISAKSGGVTERSWTITVSNNGPGVSYDTQLFGVMLTQTFGAACTFPPIRISPLEFPILLGAIPAGNAAQASLLFDFAGCPANARFSVTIGEMSNGGSSVGLIQLVNQFQ